MIAALPPAVAARIDADVTAALARFHGPGASIAVVEGATVVYRHGYGVRGASGVPVDVDTHFAIDSLTKQFTAAAIVQLKESGKLDLDDSVAKYVPSAPFANQITVRQLLTQTSGLPDYLDGADLDRAMQQPVSFAGLMARVQGKPLLFAPGSDWSYSNTNYILLGRIIEIASGETYEGYVRHHLLDRLGMRQTFTDAQESALADMAGGYQRTSNGEMKPFAETQENSWGWAAGDLVSTGDDLVTWSLGLQNGRVVTPADYALMTTPQSLPSGGNTGYGFSFFIDSKYGQPRIGHTGGGFGYTAADEYFPDQQLRVIALTNAGSDDPELGETLTNIIFADVHPELVAKAFTPKPGEDTKATATARRAFVALAAANGSDACFGAHLATKLRSGLASQLSQSLAPFGDPTAFVYQGRRAANGATWYDYLVAFSPGVMMTYSARLDPSGHVTSFSFN